MLKQKYARQNRIRLVEYSSAEVSDPSEVSSFVRNMIFKETKEVKLICGARVYQRYYFVFIDLRRNFKNL